MRSQKSLSRRKLSSMGASAARPAKPLFVGSIPTGASVEKPASAGFSRFCPRRHDARGPAVRPRFDEAGALLERASPQRDEKHTIHGNRVRIRLLRDESERAPKMIGFVHNSESDPLLLLNMTAELLELISAEADRRAPQLAGDRWLVVIGAAGISCLEAYRYIYSQLRPATDFKKTLMVFGDGHVGMLTG